MPSIVFDTYAYVKKLEAVGFTEEQAAVQAESLASLIDEQLVTGQYFDIWMEELEVRFKELEASLRHAMKEMESRIIIKLGAILAASIAVIAALVKLL